MNIKHDQTVLQDDQHKHRQQHAMFAGVGTTRCASSGPISAPIVGSGGGS